ncbi:PadR family transcriptional regulator [Agromyces sp. Marseille-Q5079]|uniref:PadR family transcriptional regulator n=1 Tax=Agromyces sp. Marseille-Q5079 TaxID=3439059 RepID=UPI003D9C9150
MAVRDALLVLLSMGPAYGFALHGGLAERTGGRRTVNVGQTYATLDRLTKQGLIEPAGSTDDGLPLHRLTAGGRAASTAWLEGADAAGADPWDETVDRVLIAHSLPRFDAASVIEAELLRWRARRDDAHPRADAVDSAAGPIDLLAARAAAAEIVRADGAISWLESARDASGLEYEPSMDRPRRGRRPGRSLDAGASADAGPQESAAP